VAYQAGIAVVIALAAVYAEQVLGFQQTQTMMLIFLVNIASAAGAFAFGYWQDRIGHRRRWRSRCRLDRDDAAGGGWPTGPGLFWVAAVMAGLCMGSSQSAGRAMAGAAGARGAARRVLRPVDLSRCACRPSSGR
jgi:MFS transporter, UMF1 family